MEKSTKKHLTATKEWRQIFTDTQLKIAETYVKKGEYDFYSWDDYKLEGRLRLTKGRGRWYDVYIGGVPQAYSDEWDISEFECGCKRNKRGFYGYWNVEPCEHMAALLLKIEEERGPWQFTETDDEMEERLKQEEREKEIERRAKQMKEEAKIDLRLDELFPRHELGGMLPFFDFRRIFAGQMTDLYRKNRMLDILQKGSIDRGLAEIGYGEDGTQLLIGKAEIFDGLTTEYAQIEISYDRVVSRYCSCNHRLYRDEDMPYCEHELTLLRRMWDYIGEENPGDATDQAAERFFDMLEESDIVLDEEEAVQTKEKAKVVSIVPRITMDGRESKLSFKVGLNNGKPLILKNFNNFVEAYDAEGRFALSKAKVIDFSEMDVTEESLPWLIFIQRRVGETERVNDRLYAKSYFGRASTLSVQSQELLTGSTLDRFYDLAEGSACEYQSKKAGINSVIQVGHADMRVRLQTEEIMDAAGGFVGVAVTGMMPVILEGVTDSYILDEHHLSRISKEEKQALIPFRKASTASGKIRFQVGKARLAEFYYRAVPNLVESRYVDFDDSCADAADEFLPPEPMFVFRLDVEDDHCICRASVSYGEWTYSLLKREVLHRPAGRPADEAIELESVGDAAQNVDGHSAEIGNTALDTEDDQARTETVVRNAVTSIAKRSGGARKKAVASAAFGMSGQRETALTAPIRILGNPSTAQNDPEEISADEKAVLTADSHSIEKQEEPEEEYHDMIQEDRVEIVVRKYFPKYEDSYEGFISDGDDPEEELYRVLTEAIPEFSKYGEVQGTEAFQRNAVRPVPQVRVGVSIESGLMDITVLSKGIAPDELLAVLESYRLKKKYHRLKSGDFISMTEDDQLSSLEEMMTALDLSSEDVIRGNVQIPAFRALYLDKMLEKHDSLVADRDRTYRKLVKNFRTIRDADYEAPQGMEEVLRPYQMYGYKWLRTLAAVGFGGILADEMGLGKTLQTIAMITGLLEEGEKRPCLIVCPASLVYNWQEEFHRFAPWIRVCPVAGTAAARKNVFKEIQKAVIEGAYTDAEDTGAAKNDTKTRTKDMKSVETVKVRTKDVEKMESTETGAKADTGAKIESTGTQSEEVAIKPKKRGRRKKTADVAENLTREIPQVFVTSYDLLRKDIAQYENMTFSVMVLDEAQYIKNQKAGLTKAVKIVHAEHRFALTGTPIENRLAELWSIFDFLMPGFLYKYDEFAEKFEVPITKGKNQEAADRLKQLVGPFILRRLKTDVLKDLPPKLEEVRYARFEDEQRKVYDGQVVRMKQMISGATSGENDRIRIFAELTRIRQICCDPGLFLEDYRGGSAKRQACLELVKSAIGGGHRILLFSQFTSMLALLEEDLAKEGITYYKIIGSTPKEKRIRMVRDFNENDVPVFLISLKAGGTGLNLTGADVVIHYDPWWNLAAQNQATDRAHRIGQEKQVTVYRLIMKDTIEEKILALQEAKKDLAEAILSGESESIYTLSGEELLALL